jgi:hypothetical protein
MGITSDYYDWEQTQGNPQYGYTKSHERKYKKDLYTRLDTLAYNFGFLPDELVKAHQEREASLPKQRSPQRAGDDPSTK